MLRHKDQAGADGTIAFHSSFDFFFQVCGGLTYPMYLKVPWICGELTYPRDFQVHWIGNSIETIHLINFIFKIPYVAFLKLWIVKLLLQAQHNIVALWMKLVF